MAGGHMKYRTLSRDSAHRKALLRNLVTSLVKLESIQTTYAKAKEAQTVADKLITLAKRNNETARRKAQGILFTPDRLLPKLFGELRERYANRPGGYTRVLRIEPINRHYQDQAPSAILEFVDGKVDTRFTMTAAAYARAELQGYKPHPTTLLNRKKVTQFRKDGKLEFSRMVEAIKETMPRGVPRSIDHAPLHYRNADKAAEEEEDVDEYKDEDFDVDDGAEKREGRGARQRRLRREEKAARNAGDDDFTNAGEVRGRTQQDRLAQIKESESQWEDLEEAVEEEYGRTQKSKRALKKPKKLKLGGRLRFKPRA